ncbi:MAG: hypothetical protein V7784_17920 [Oceanospirillaceae bacterium]
MGNTMLVLKKYNIPFMCLSLLAMLCVHAKAQTTLVFSELDINNHNSLKCKAVLRMALESLDYTLETIKHPGARALLMSNRGATSGIIARTTSIEKDYHNLKRIPIWCSKEFYYGYTKKKDKFSFLGWSAIPSDHVLGYRRGDIFMENIIKQYSFKTVRLNNLQQELKMLEAGRINIIVESPTLFNEENSILKIKDIVQLEPAIRQFYFYIYVHKKHENLFRLLTSTMIEMKINGEIK